MKTKQQPTLAAIVALVIAISAPLVQAQGSGFTYQGLLHSGASPANGAYDLGFVVCSAASGPNFVSGIVTNTATPVSNGLFAVTLDFGPGVFTGDARWLQIFVRTNGGGGFAALSPRQPLTPAPYAITASNLTGTVSATQLSGTVALSQLPAAVVTNNASGVTLSGTFSGNGGALTNLDADTLAGQNAGSFASATHAHPALTATGGLSGGTYDGTSAASFSVVYGTTAGSAVQGNQTATVIAGAGLTGGVTADALGDGFSVTLNVGGGSGIEVIGDSLRLGPLTSDWSQTGPYDLVLGHASSEIKILESAGNTFYGTLDVGDLSAPQTYTFSGTSGTVWTSGNDGEFSGLDADLLGGFSAAAFLRTDTSGTLSSLTISSGTLQLPSGSAAAAALAFTGDPNTGLFRPATDTLAIATAGAERVRVTSAGNVGIGNPNPTNSLIVVNARCDGSSWINASDRNLKQDFTPVDPQAVLDKVAALSIQAWSYKAQPGQKHLGPVAQDFHSAFGLGPDDTSIATVDAAGVALAAIQGLNHKLEQKLGQKETEITALKARLEVLEQIIRSRSPD